MKASEAFFLGLPRRILRRPKKKVFIIGFHKTGTSSMGKAFQILGYRVCGNLKEGFDFKKQDKPAEKYIFSKAKTLLPRFDCFQDTPWFMFYKELYEVHPNAYFILTVRPEENWIQSVVNHFGNRDNSPYHEWIYGHADPRTNEETYLQTYQEHNRSVKDFFKHKSNFIVFNLKENDKWEKLCAFLGVPEPKISFPYVNTSKSRNSYYRKLKLQVKKIYYKR
ncbi:MAG: sulfotransferase [Balneolaceae bacterium]|nr:sulfotransferase [Balneolaceae bacterium]